VLPLKIEFKHMKRSFLILLFLFVSIYGFSQITAAEYFIDIDPGVGNGTTLTMTGNIINENYSVPTTGLSDGVHKLYVRVQHTDGSWSLYDRNVFYINPDQSNSALITAAEYFIDTDPGVGNGTALTMSGGVIDENYNIPTTGLSDGVHKLYVRAINADGTWSLYDKNVFYVNPNNSNSALITAAEYFFDTDPGVGNGTALTMTGNIIDENYSVSTTGLSDGVHKLYVRTINANGTWSLYDKNVFYVSPNNSNSALITAAEYFIDTDPGVGNATYIEITDTSNFDEDLVVDIPNDLTDGDHFLYIRVLNTVGEWSLYAQSETLTTLSIQDFVSNNFRFYPNPVKDILYFDTNNQIITDFKVIDLNGRVVLNDIPVNYQIDISHLSSGVYLFQIKTEESSVSKKFIKK
jgi:hypothetical protein